ncbi:MAG TPA: hypothetical protein VHT05_14745 [Candidatus Elarobacter sp.]|jgi:hypothetical protein|nr:hypothetical protein [Candidatus Elarobacter sp.]
MTPEEWRERLLADVVHLLQFESEAGKIDRRDGGIRAGPYTVVTTPSDDGKRITAGLTKDELGPVEDSTYTTSLDEDPITIAYALATRLGFYFDSIKKPEPG